MKLSPLVLLGLVLATAATSSAALAEQWRRYADPQRRFEIELPVTSFQISDAVPGRLTMTEVGGAAIIDVYTGVNSKLLTPSEFADELSNAGEIKDITYRTGGRTWFVVSGHYAGKPLTIYYAKYLFSGGLRRVAGLEISYPVGEMARMDRIVVHLEQTFRLP
jgi:hypothetical protein